MRGSPPTIFLAKEAASAYDTIRVAAGTYPEGAIWITKPLTLLGAQAGVDARGRTVAPGTETIIMPAVAPNMPILVLGPGAAGTIIDGFTLLGGNLAIQNGLQPGESNDNLQVRNNRIVGFWAAGIALEAQGTDITIEQNYVDGSGVNHPDMLVSVWGNAPYPGLWLVNNTIVNGRMHADGFRVLQSSAIVEPSLTRAPLIKGNTLSGAPRSFWWEGPDGSRVLTMFSTGYDSGLLPPGDWPHRTWLAMVMGGLNWYLHSHVKWRFDYGFGRVDGRTPEGNLNINLPDPGRGGFLTTT